MNFFDYQNRARVWTRWLVMLYALAVVLIVLAVYAAVRIVFEHAPFVGRHGPDPLSDGLGFWRGDLFLWTTGATLLILLGGTAYKMIELSGGGAVVARLLGGTPVAPGTADPAEQRLRNVVEEMAIASGTPVPQIFVLPDEPGINAFAAGQSPNDAVVTVTRGALQRLTRDELQGVIAHEFSHILNGDMRMNVRLMGLLHGILLIALTGYAILRVTGRMNVRRSGKGGNPLPLLGLLLMVVGYIGVFIANLIKAAIGREREYLADASAVQFTRNPSGLAGAFKKIGALSEGGAISLPEAAQTSHFFIAEPGIHSWLNLLDTHPPLLERIRRLEPSFTGDFSAVSRRINGGLSGAPSAPAAARRPPPHSSTPTVVSGLVNRVGAPEFQHVAYAAALLQAIPDVCRRAVTETAGAQGVVFALILSGRPDVMQRQRARLASAAPGNVYARLTCLEEYCRQMPPASRLPLADLAVSALRDLGPDEYRAFRENLMALVLADDAVDLFEFTLLHLVARRLDRHFGLTREPRIGSGDLDASSEAAGRVLSLLAWHGTEDGAAAETAYARGWESIRGEAPAPIRDRKDTSLAELEASLNRLAALAPQEKGRFLTACGACVASDGRTTLREAETLRAIADSLDCPVPPFAPEAE